MVLMIAFCQEQVAPTERLLSYGKTISKHGLNKVNTCVPGLYCIQILAIIICAMQNSVVVV